MGREDGEVWDFVNWWSSPPRKGRWGHRMRGRSLGVPLAGVVEVVGSVVAEFEPDVVEGGLEKARDGSEGGEIVVLIVRATKEDYRQISQGDNLARRSAWS